MSKYLELRKIDVGQHIEKKNGLSYLSWSWAVDVLLQNDPTATWEFAEPVMFGETMMVMCEVRAFGKTMNMHLPVMDFKNQAIKNPDAVAVNKAMMRCLAKCIATFGIGLYIFSGEDIPSETVESVDVEPLVSLILQAETMDKLKKAYLTAYESVKRNPEALKALEMAKDTRKIQLEQTK